MHPLVCFHDTVSSFTHLAGAVLFGFLAWLLIRRAEGHAARWFLVVYTVACVYQLGISGVYHSLAPGAERQLLLQCDMAAIFALIAGTFTAVHGLMFTGLKRWLPLVFVWTIGVVGMALAWFFYDSVPSSIWLKVYLAQGWFGLISAGMLWRELGVKHIRLPVYGGIVFTIGGIIEAHEEIAIVPNWFGAHEIFHLAVLLGMWCFWKYIYTNTVSVAVPVAKPPVDEEVEADVVPAFQGAA